MRLWKPPQIEIANSIGDDTVERVSILKSARVGGATQLMVGGTLGGHFVENDPPSPVLCVVPAEADARHLMVSVIEPTFQESPPSLRAALSEDSAGRDTMLHRRFAGGGSLSIVSARAPRNLRARTARILFADEIDAYELSAGTEGDPPVELAMRRTMTFGNRRIVLASTPVDAETSRILRAYEQSDQRVFEVPCPPHCGQFSEILWADMKWDADKPETAHWCCPSCEGRVEDRQKAQIVAAGRWRALAAHVEGHRGGYKLTSLTSTLPNATWPKLAAEFLQAKRSPPTTLKPWLNTVLGEAWRGGEGDDLDSTDFAALQRPFGMETLPEDALVLTVGGGDVQKDRVELTYTGWTADGGDMRVLGHVPIWGGDPTDAETWVEVEDALRRQFRHPLGGVLNVDAAVIDSGNWADQVYDFCRPPRTARRVLPGKGVSGFSRPSLAFSSSRKVRLALIGGVDGGVKLALHQRLAHGETILFSEDLSGDYFDQIRAERLVTKFSRGGRPPMRVWEVISGRRNEALDTLAYSYAARQLVGLDMERRESDLMRKDGPKKAPPTVVKSAWLER